MVIQEMFKQEIIQQLQTFDVQKLHKEYKKLYHKSILNRIKLKTLDNQVFSRNRPLIREQFNIFFKKFRL